jgi:hypothetical protein
MVTASRRAPSGTRASGFRPGWLLAIGAVLLAGSASGQWQQNGEPVPDEPWRRSDGDFGAMLMLTDRADDFLAQWQQPARPGYRPSLHSVSEARRGDTVTALILFTRCEASVLGECRSDLDWRVVRPDGSLYASHREVELWNAPPPPRGALQLGAGELTFEIERDDPFGRYEIHADVHDRVGDRRVSLVRVLTVLGEASPREAPTVNLELHDGDVSLRVPAAWRRQRDETRSVGRVLLYEIPFAATDSTPHTAQLLVRTSAKTHGAGAAEHALAALRVDLERPDFAVLASALDSPERLTILSTGGDAGARYAIVDRFAVSSRWFVQLRIALPLLGRADGWYDQHVPIVDEVLASLALQDRRLRGSRLQLQEGILTLTAADSTAPVVAPESPGLRSRFPEGAQGLVVYARPNSSPADAR